MPTINEVIPMLHKWLFTLFIVAFAVWPTISIADTSLCDGLVYWNSSDTLDNYQAHMFSRQASDGNKQGIARPDGHSYNQDDDESDEHKDKDRHGGYSNDSYHKVPPKPVKHYRNPVVHHTTYYRPSHSTVVYVKAQPVYEDDYDLYEDRSVNVVDNTVSSVTHTDTHTGYIGFGLRILGSRVNDYILSTGDVETTNISPGVGWYVKIRPIRWVSVELLNDYIFVENNYGDTYTRIPLYLGLHTHLFDYGNLDLYFITDIGFSYIQMYDKFTYMDSTFMQWGGQFGVGLSFLFSHTEVGVDIRYTVESSPSDHWGYSTYMEYSDQVVHGILFAFVIGLSI